MGLLDLLRDQFAKIPDPRRFFAFAGILVVLICIAVWRFALSGGTSTPTPVTPTTGPATASTTVSVRGQITSFNYPSSFAMKVTLISGSNQSDIGKDIPVQTTTAQFNIPVSHSAKKANIHDLKVGDTVSLQGTPPATSRSGAAFVATAISIIDSPSTPPKKVKTQPKHVVKKTHKLAAATPKKLTAPPAAPTTTTVANSSSIATTPSTSIPTTTPVPALTGSAPANDPISAPSGERKAPLPTPTTTITTTVTTPAAKKTSTTTPSTKKTTKKTSKKPAKKPPAKLAIPAYNTFVLADEPLAYYHLDQTSSAVAHDSSGHHNNGQYDAGLKLGVSGAITGFQDSAVNFLGQPTSLISLPDTLLSSSSSFTFECWLSWPGVQLLPATATTPVVATYNQRIFTFASSSGYITLTPGAAQADGSSKIQFAVSTTGNPSEEVLDGEAMPSGDGWHQLVVTYNGTTAQIFVDGKKVAAGSFSIPLSAIGPATMIHALGQEALTGDSPFKGGLDEVAFYPQVLTANAIARHFRAGIGEATEADAKIVTAETAHNKQSATSTTTSSTTPSTTALPSTSATSTTAALTSSTS